MTSDAQPSDETAIEQTHSIKEYPCWKTRTTKPSSGWLNRSTECFQKQHEYVLCEDWGNLIPERRDDVIDRGIESGGLSALVVEDPSEKSFNASRLFGLQQNIDPLDGLIEDEMIFKQEDLDSLE